MASVGLLWIVAWSFITSAPWAFRSNRAAPMGSGVWGDIHDLDFGETRR